MKKLSIFIFTFLLLGLAYGQKKGPAMKISKVQSSEIQWWGYKVVKSDLTTHTGFVNLKKGNFYFKDKKLQGGDFILDMRTLGANDLVGEEQVKLTNDLRGTNFFNVKKFPVALFQITNIIPSRNGDYNSTVYGNLTVKGVRKTISFPANIRINEYFVELESAKFSLNRQDYNVFYKSSLKDYLIKDDIDIKIKLTAK